jgi:small-conductance mechanosensitive channel
MKNFNSSTLIFLILLLVYITSTVVAQKGDPGLNTAQLDSIAQDSVTRVIASEEVATLVPSYYASLIVEVNADIYPQIRAANGIVNDPMILRLQQDYDELSRLTDYVISRNNVLEGIESLTNQWENNLEQIKEYTEDLKSRTSDLVEMKRELAEERNAWVDRRSKLRYGKHLEQVNKYVQTSIDTIDFFFVQSATTLDTVTITYTQLTELQLQTQRYVDVLSSIRHDRLNKMLRNRGDFIWKSGVNTDINTMDSQLTYLRTIGLKDTRYYIKEHKGDIANTFLFFIVIAIVFYWTRHRSLMMDDDEEPEIVRNAHILGRPMTMSVLFTVIAMTFLLPNKPPLLNYIVSILILYSILSILVNMLRKPARWTAFVLAGLFVLLQVVSFVRDDQHYSRWLSLFASSVLVYLLFWIQRNKSRFKDHGKRLWQRIYVGLSGPLLVLAALAFLANIVGYGAIAELINKGIIFTLIIALLLVAMYQSTASILYHFLDTTLAKRSFILRENGHIIFEKTISILGVITILLYGYYCLNFFLLWEIVENIFIGIWKFGYAFGTVNLTIGDLVSVFITIIIFWIIANVVQTIMRRELFPRFNLPRGIGNAVASITHYSLIVIGVFLALAAAGFEMKHLGIMIGALGVGIGFGLQNIVNNFLSGLILIFERPITVDDVVEVDGILGVVTSIGIRASRIRQYNGDEMIVPNADLISKKVTNRTLSDTKRRYTMNFETGRNEDPERVIAIISEAAQGVDGILSVPPAKGYFKGLDKQSIKFYVNYWGTGNFLDLMSAVEQAVFAALEREGIKMPVPVQIEVQKKENDTN